MVCDLSCSKKRKRMSKWSSSSFSVSALLWGLFCLRPLSRSWNLTSSWWHQSAALIGYCGLDVVRAGIINTKQVSYLGFQVLEARSRSGTLKYLKGDLIFDFPNNWVQWFPNWDTPPTPSLGKASTSKLAENHHQHKLWCRINNPITFLHYPAFQSVTNIHFLYRPNWHFLSVFFSSLLHLDVRQPCSIISFFFVHPSCIPNHAVQRIIPRVSYFGLTVLSLTPAESKPTISQH